MVLKVCNADREIQWLFGSDMKMYTYEKQVNPPLPLPHTHPHPPHPPTPTHTTPTDTN